MCGCDSFLVDENPDVHAALRRSKVEAIRVEYVYENSVPVFFLVATGSVVEHGVRLAGTYSTAELAEAEMEAAFADILSCCGS